MLDLRVPSGLFFASTGLILVGMGLFSSARPHLSEANVNLYAGMAMLLFGLIMLGLSRQRK